MNDVMIDIETMGTGINAPILSIGACWFDIATGAIGETLYSLISLDGEMRHGAVPEADTIKWWLKQGDEARDHLTGDYPLLGKTALAELLLFLRGGPVVMPKVWSNGAGFDLVLLRAAFKRHQIDFDLKFYYDRDVRTIVDLGQRLLNIDPKRDTPFDGVAHHALGDAIFQATYVSAIYQALQQKLQLKDETK